MYVYMDIPFEWHVRFVYAKPKDFRWKFQAYINRIHGHMERKMYSVQISTVKPSEMSWLVDSAMDFNHGASLSLALAYAFVLIEATHAINVLFVSFVDKQVKLPFIWVQTLCLFFAFFLSHSLFSSRSVCVSVSNLVIYYPLNARNERGNARVAINHSNFLTRFSFEMAFGLKATNSLRPNWRKHAKTIYSCCCCCCFIFSPFLLVPGFDLSIGINRVKNKWCCHKTTPFRMMDKLKWDKMSWKNKQTGSTLADF